MVFILLLIFLVVALGVICICASDHPAQTIDRILAAIPAVPPLLEIWSLVAAALAITSVRVARLRLDPERASPAALQRFLF